MLACMIKQLKIKIGMDGGVSMNLIHFLTAT